MGLYWKGYKTRFEEIAFLETRIQEIDFWDNLLKYCDEIDVHFKDTYIIQNTTPIEYGTKYMSVNQKWFYNTFFYYTIWLTFTEEDEKFINKKKYALNTYCDDLGWLQFDSVLYLKSFSTKTLKMIVKDFVEVDFNLIREKFTLSRLESQKVFSVDEQFNLLNYQKETEETFINFVNLTNQVIIIYQECVEENKDLIIEKD